MTNRLRIPVQAQPLPDCFRDRRGVALPTALVCLLALTLLVTGALLSASTDAMTSLAQQAAAEDLYAAEGAIEAWIAERAEALQPEEVNAWTPPGGSIPVRLRVERLARWITDGEAPERLTLFAVHAEAIRSSGGGRSVVGMVIVRQEQLPVVQGEGRSAGSGDGGAAVGGGGLGGITPANQPAWGTPRIQGRSFGWFEVVR